MVYSLLEDNMNIFTDPKKLALLNAGVNMLAASRGGNPDLTKGGLGYGLQQGLLGAAQGYQMGNQFKDKAREDAVKEQFMGLLGGSQAHGGMPTEGGILGGSQIPNSPVPQQQPQIGLPQKPQLPFSPAQAQAPTQPNMFDILTPQEKAMAGMMVQSGDMKGVYAMIENRRRSITDAKADFTDIGGMRKELEPLAKEAREVKSNFDSLYQTLTKEKPNAVDDVAVVFQYMKSLDPGSVVREGEQIMLKRTDGIFGVLGNYLQGIKNGQTFNSTQRRNILESAYGNFKSRMQPLYEAGIWRGDIAERSGVNRSDVVSPIFGKIPDWYKQYGDKNTWPKITPVSGNAPYTPTNNNDYEPL